jgi:hypothetical protein
MNADLVTIVYSCRCALVVGFGKNLNKVVVKVKCVSSWMCLLRNYVTVTYG